MTKNIDIAIGGAVSRRDLNRMDSHAERYYEEIRKRNSDVEAIAKNTGYDIDDIAKIKHHVFIEKHDLGKKNPVRFVPDYDMAVSWQRLIDGNNIKEMDLIMLKHELSEYNYMLTGMDFFTAHELTEKEFNYSKYIKALDLAEGLL